MKPQIIIKSVQMDDPTFEGGSTRVARATISNPTSKQFTYDIELYLASDVQGINKVASSGVVSVTVPAGGNAQATFPISMPSTEAVYSVFLNVKVAGTPLTLYKATDNVTIQVTPAVEIGTITWT